MAKFLSAAFIGAVSLCSILPALAQPSPHAHNVGVLNLAISGDQLVFELTLPASDVVGFEHVATNEDEAAAITEALQLLEQVETLIVLPEAANCTLEHARARYGAEHYEKEHSDGHDHGHTESYTKGELDEHEHLEFKVSAGYKCETPESATTITLPVFQVYSSLLEIRVTIVSGGLATATSVNRDSGNLRLQDLH